MASCAPGTSTQTTSSSYSEDISVYRPEYSDPIGNNIDTVSRDQVEVVDIDPEYDITASLDSLLDSIAINDKKLNYVQGFTILVYTGSSRSAAIKARGKVYQIFPEARPQMIFTQPNFKVKVGRFYNRLEAQETFAELKAEFPDAILAPERIWIRD